MSKFVLGNLFLFLSILTASTGQVIIKSVFLGLPSDASTWEAIKIIILTERVWRTGFAAVLIVLGFLCWLLCLHRLPLSYAYPIACSSVLVVTFLCVWLLGETVSWRLWVGTLLIALGSSLVVFQK